MNVMFLGSCLSSSIVSSFLDQNDANLIGSFTHLRSDFVLNFLEGDTSVGCEPEFPIKLIEKLAGYFSDNQRDRLLHRFSCQSTHELKKLVKSITKADVIIIDNNYDLGRNLYKVKHEDDTYLFSNLILKPGACVEIIDKLDKYEVYKYERRLIERLIKLNSKVKIFFINYPITGFKNRGSKEDLLRVERANETNMRFKQECRQGGLPDNLCFIGCIELSEELISKKGVLYFKGDFYRAVSRFIKMTIDGKQHLRFVDNFDQLRSVVCNKLIWEKTSPYENLPDSRYWKPAVAEPYPLAITDLYSKKFDIEIKDAVATCGSCFAQHIGKRLDKRGYNYIDVEPKPKDMPLAKAKGLGYGIYSARYGNVYTSRQLVQLFERAFEKLEFNEVWKNKEQRFVDAFRPNLCGEGYETEQEVLDEQEAHLTNVRKMFETLDVFVFTMGLTETWINKGTGAVYPICPGVTAGEFNSDIYEFVNLDYATILEEMELFFSKLKEVNPKAKVLLTVSPVPLTATAEDRHVLVSTMASKAILRAVADQLYRKHEYVDYFPSYDIIMSPPFKSMFFKNNLRSIHEEGVDFVMSHFFSEHQLKGEGVSAVSGDTVLDDEAFCDEVFLELERKTGNLNADE